MHFIKTRFPLMMRIFLVDLREHQETQGEKVFKWYLNLIFKF